MRVAFVGIKRSPADMPPGYWPTFVRYHLELPWYYARFAPIHVDIVHPEVIGYSEDFTGLGGGSIRCVTESQHRECIHGHYDVIVHWRRWHDDLCDQLSRNVILSQDHSYDDVWKRDVIAAYRINLLDGILVFPTWHRENTHRELGGTISWGHLYDGMTLGVDVETYCPASKDPYHLLWASDPGRGLADLIGPFMRLWTRDRRFRLTVTYPDYVRPETVAPFSQFLSHPAVTHLPGLRNGPKLWDLFNSSGILPYSSRFMEPSSRCHRQAMAAGSMVLYPPNMGTPSQLIENGMTGIVEEPREWPDIIYQRVSDGSWEDLGKNARTLAVSESWQVQAQRFHRFFSGV